MKTSQQQATDSKITGRQSEIIKLLKSITGLEETSEDNRVIEKILDALSFTFIIQCDAPCFLSKAKNVLCDEHYKTNKSKIYIESAAAVKLLLFRREAIEDFYRWTHSNKEIRTEFYISLTAYRRAIAAGYKEYTGSSSLEEIKYFKDLEVYLENKNMLETPERLLFEFFDYELNIINSIDQKDLESKNKKTEEKYSIARKYDGNDIEQMISEFYNEADIDRALSITDLLASFMELQHPYWQPCKFLTENLMDRNKSKYNTAKQLAINIINSKKAGDNCILGYFILGELKHLSPQLDLPSAVIPGYKNITNHRTASKAVTSLVDKGNWQLALYSIIHVNFEYFMGFDTVNRTLVILAKILSHINPEEVDELMFSKLSPDAFPDFLSEKIIDFSINSNNIEIAEMHLLKLKKSGYLTENIKIAEEGIRKIKLQNRCVSQGIDPNAISLMSGIEFESLIIRKLKDYGLKAEGTKSTGDFGADIIAEDVNGTRFAIQCKRYASRVNLKAVQEVVSSCSYYSCDIGVVITNNTFLKSAVELANKNSVELWDQAKLLAFLGEENFETELTLQKF